MIFGCKDADRATSAPSQRQEPAPLSSPPAEPYKKNTRAPSFALFKQPAKPAVFELPSGALSSWRQFSGEKPALVLFSTHPLLQPIADDRRQTVRDFVLTASPQELVRRGQKDVADTLFVPPQTVSAAIDAGLISELIFVRPTLAKPEQISLPTFQQSVFDAGFLTAAETGALTMKDGIISGTLRGIPFRVVHPTLLPKISKPVIVHIDLGYFKDLFVNEVKTPIYPMLAETVTSIRDAGNPVIALTLSYSNREVGFSLDTRFVISNLADIAVHPELMGTKTPPNWILRAEAMSASALFHETDAREKIVQAAELVPKDPDALYALSQLRFQQHQAAEGFDILDKAVAIDPGYALAYLELADTGIDLGKIDKSLELFDKAAAVMPDNPFIKLRKAQLLLKGGKNTEALTLINELKQLPWSEEFHGEAPKQLDLLSKAALTAAGQKKNP